MTQADNATALRRSLDPESITDGQGQAKTINARTPLPRGWASFCSKPDSDNPSYWYAVAPWNLVSLMEKYGPSVEYLTQMVVSETWAGLHKEVQAQEKLYREATSNSAER